MDNLQATLRSKDLGALIDLVTDLDPQAHPFLHYLPQLFEQNILNPITLGSFVVFAQASLKRDVNPLLIDAFHVLNQLIDPHDGSMLTPTQATFFDNRNFTWKELGSFTDPTSLIFHVVNKTVMVLELGKK